MGELTEILGLSFEAARRLVGTISVRMHLCELVFSVLH